MIHVGVLQFCLEIPWATSLKDKRRVVQSLKEQVRRNYNVSVAEIADLDEHTIATMAASMVGNDPAYVNGAMDKLINDLHDWREATLVDHMLEIPVAADGYAVNERRIHRLEALIKSRAAAVLQHEMSDPRLGLITITRVKLDREMQSCKIYWSVIGDDKLRKMNERTLKHAAGYVQHAIAEVLPTRNVPHVTFEFDASIEGAMRVQNILARLAAERAARGEPPVDVDPEFGHDSDAEDDGDDWPDEPDQPLPPDPIAT